MKYLMRLMSSFSKSKSFFSKKDDLVICKSFLEKGILDEPALAQQLERMPRNILYRWIYHILPSIENRGDLRSKEFQEDLKLKIKELENGSAESKSRRYTPEEDARVLMLVDRFGTDWNLLSEEMKTRSAISIYHRYTSTLKPGLKNYTVPFTKEEDDIIKEFMESKGKQMARRWAYLSKIRLPNRSPDLIRYRWKILNSDTSQFTLSDYKKFINSLAEFGPDFVKIARECFPKKEPLFLRNFWVHGLRRSVPEFFTLKWTREMDQKLIDCCIAAGFDISVVFKTHFPQVGDMSEIKHRLAYLFKLVTPNQKCIPSFPFDNVFDRLKLHHNQKQTKQDTPDGYHDLHLKYKIPTSLIKLRKTAFNRHIDPPFTKLEDDKLIKLVTEALKEDPLGRFAVNPSPWNKSRKRLDKIRNEKVVTLEVSRNYSWGDFCIILRRRPCDCKNRWTQLKYDYYH